MEPNATTEATTNPDATTVDTAAAAPHQDHASQDTSWYISNPFLNALRGLVAVLKHNPVSIMLTSVIGIGGYFAVYLFTLAILSSGSAGLGVIAFLIWVATFVAAMVIYGAFIHIGGMSAKEETVSTTDALRLGLKKTLPLLGLMIVLGFVISFGFVLLIVPGVIFLARFSLSPFVMFEENLGVFASIKRSAELTKGHVNEMLGALTAGAFLGGQGLLVGATSLAPIVGRYHDLKKLHESGAPAPKTHWLNYSYLIIPVLVILFAVISATSIVKQSNLNNDPYQFNTPTPTYEYNNYNDTYSQ